MEDMKMPQITDSRIIRERLSKARECMTKAGVDVYVVCTGDYHMSEYAGDYFGERQFLSGFTGSAGTLVIGKDEAVLFTDGRYFVQAQLQLSGTGIELMKMGVQGAVSLTGYCESVLPDGGTLGLDARTVDAVLGNELESAVSKKNGNIDYKFNCTQELWEDRPAFPHSAAFEAEAGESCKDKLRRLREKMKELKTDAHVITTLDDICWLFNIRARDVKCNPVLMSYSYITMDSAVIYADDDRFSQQLKSKLCDMGVSIRPYETFYDDLGKIKQDSVLVDLKRINFYVYRLLKKSGVRMVTEQNPTVLMKAVKNDTEIRNLKAVHIDDGLALTRFMFWLKNTVGKEEITEFDAAVYLDSLRAEIYDFIEPSFDTISAYGANAAMMHYSAAMDNCSVLKPEGMLLVDSGGQYMRGTTDVTRTFALGPVTDECRKAYTLTLKGMLALADAHFLYGCTGLNLDILARGALWAEGLDYRCGTGHGVGYLLNVHEAPNNFRWKHAAGHGDTCVIEPGMVTSDEPGVYVDGQYGIRIENEILCVRDSENEYGTFLKFEMLTCVPVDLELVDCSYLDGNDLRRLNSYHEWVYKSLSPHMHGSELEFLKRATRAVGKDI